ncbi:hypothetical protein [Chitinophaga rhizophila]|uniref:Uncharacterized protein n=1 Tax=Chitinophaga rhizophila TaxID=2866212 RepID=A0ABS7G8F2_9BACT|nr:hypothetical protein [Chitinophaga rhizophila]MBW8683671.1 hypothetical protein [Chitinophaga rhizophila]
MAKQTSLITFTGRLGNMIGYRRNRKFYLRSMPAIVRQTTATRRAAQRFGIASKHACLVRKALIPALDIPCDGHHVNRMNQLLMKGRSNRVCNLTGYRFNECTGITQLIGVAPYMGTDGRLYIPAQTLPAVKGCDAVEITVIVTRISFAYQQIKAVRATKTILQAGVHFDGAVLPVDIEGKGTLIIAVQVRLMCEGRPVCNSKQVAADILAVYTPDTGTKPGTDQTAVVPAYSVNGVPAQVVIQYVPGPVLCRRE